jgi:two-component system sensor histidine kinase UhpB
MPDTAPSRREKDAIAEESLGYLRTLDLHDETGQLLTAILLNLQHLGSHATAPGVADTVRDTQRLVETLFYAIRNYVRGASVGKPAAATAPPALVPAIERLADDFSRRTGINVRLALDPDTERVPGPHKAVFYRVVQESLTNVFRHSSAAVVTIRSSRTGSVASLEIEDDGATRPAPPRRAGSDGRAAGMTARVCGAAGAGRPAGGTGLRGMRERVRLAGGECTVEMVKERGMTVKVVLPYNVS